MPQHRKGSLHKQQLTSGFRFEERRIDCAQLIQFFIRKMTEKHTGQHAKETAQSKAD